MIKDIICKILIFSVLLMANTAIFGKNAYQIKVKIDNYSESELYLGNRFADKTYIKDTAKVTTDGFFIFQGAEELPGGIYLIIFKDKKFLEILVDKEDQNFSIQTDYNNLFEKLKFKNSPTNELFYNYMTYLSKKRPDADSLRAQIGRTKEEKEKSSLEQKMSKLDEDVINYQNKVAEKNPKSMVAALINSSKEVSIPDFKGSEKEVQMKKYLYYRAHYFDNMNLADSRLMRTNILDARVNFFISKLTPQHPDSISVAIDYLLEKMKPSDDIYHYYVVQFLNNYAKSDLVGMDAVYVHIAKKYYASGQAPWISKEDSAKIVKNAETLEPILIGKKAPQLFPLERRDSTLTSLYDQLTADYNVLIFWASDCGHCKKTAPKMVEFEAKYAKKNTKVITICTDKGSVGKCWESVDERKFDKMTNLTDSFIRSRYFQIYDVRTTPKVYVIAKDKEILMKNVSFEQMLDENILDKLIEGREKEKKK